MSQPDRKRPHRRFHYANVMSTIAVFLVVAGGSAQALSGHNTVFSDDIVNGEVRNPDLRNNVVTSPKIRNGGVRNLDLLNGAVTSAKIRDGQVTTPDLANNAVNNAQLADGAVGGEKLADLAVSGEKISSRTITTRHFQLGGGASLNFPSTPAGNCSSLVYDAPGGINGASHVLVTPLPNFADTFTLTAKVVVATDDLKFVACNVFGGGGSADPDGGGGFYRYLVITQA